MYIRKKANKHEGLCCIFTLREKLVIEKKKRKNEDVPLSQERRSNLTKKKMRKTYIDISCSNNYAAFPDQINN